MAAGLRLPRSSQGFFFYFSKTLIKPSQVFVRPTVMQALPLPINSIIIMTKILYKGLVIINTLFFYF